MSAKFRQSTWGEQIDTADSHIKYLEQVRRHHADRPNFRADEFNQAREVAGLLRRRMKELGKRRSSAFWPNSLEGAA